MLVSVSSRPKSHGAGKQRIEAQLNNKNQVGILSESGESENEPTAIVPAPPQLPKTQGATAAESGKTTELARDILSGPSQLPQDQGPPAPENVKPWEL